MIALISPFDAAHYVGDFELRNLAIDAMSGAPYRNVERQPWFVPALSVTALVTRQHCTRDIGFKPIGLGKTFSPVRTLSISSRSSIAWGDSGTTCGLRIFILLAGIDHNLVSKSISPD